MVPATARIETGIDLQIAGEVEAQNDHDDDRDENRGPPQERRGHAALAKGHLVLDMVEWQAAAFLHIADLHGSAEIADHVERTLAKCAGLRSSR